MTEAYTNPAARAARDKEWHISGLSLRGPVNVGPIERWASGVGGGIVMLSGLKRGTLGGLAMAVAGGFFVYRGETGYCGIYQTLGINTSDEARGPWSSVTARQGVKVEKTTTINRPPEELYRFWRDFSNLPRIMKHLESVTTRDGNRSHWVARAPLGATVEWDAEIHNERENELIAWRSIEGSQVDTAGSVRFVRAPGNRGTEVHVSLKYNPPLGQVGAAVAKLFGEEPDLQVQEDLRRFKMFMEAGEIATVEGQPSGRKR
jgi:uncharacterized membrane protein